MNACQPLYGFKGAPGGAPLRYGGVIIEGTRNGMTIMIGSGARTSTMDEAKAAVAGYAFGTAETAGPSGTELRPRWAYRTYDCIPASPGETFSDLDILVAAGLNARLTAWSIAAAQLAVRRAAPPSLPRPHALGSTSPT
jgi:hypothetical protein